MSQNTDFWHKVVTKNNIEDVCMHLSGQYALALDTETTGLRWCKGDRLFSIAIASRHTEYYFNFQMYNPKTFPAGRDPKDYLLTKDDYELLRFVTKQEQIMWFMHNAKFDMHMMANEDIYFGGSIWCTMSQARLLRNDLMNYGLDSLAQRWLLGAGKDPVKEYIQKNKLYITRKVPGKKTSEKLMFFHKVPFEVITPYALKDARLTFDLGMFQNEGFEKIDKARKPSVPPIYDVVQNEIFITKAVWRLERIGMLIDKPYCEQALQELTVRYEAAEKEYQALSGIPFNDHANTHSKAFAKFGLGLPTGPRGGMSCDDDWLRAICATPVNQDKRDVPEEAKKLAETIRAFRSAYKKAGTYFGAFLDRCDSDGFLHADFLPGGTATGRFSCREPNLQNMEKECDDGFPVRKALLAMPDFCWFLPDYDQMEYKLMMDYAGETSVIKKVLDGEDLHQSTADMVGISRKAAKTLNFLLLYGGGIGKLAGMLGITEHEAKELKDLYFARLPMVSKFVETVRAVAASRKYTFNWMGRRYQWASASDKMLYTCPANYLIQGGSADVMKVAMVRTDQLLIKLQSCLVGTVHDELPCYIHKDELDIAPKIVEIMETVYNYKHLPLTASPEYSWMTMADKIKGYPKP